MNSNVYIEATNRETLDLVRRMAVLAQYRDPEVMNHLERVRATSYILAKGMGMSHEEATLLSYASLLHDIGEVAIPESVLSKAGSLDPQEWILVRQHPRAGAELLRGSPSIVLQAAEVIAQNHHERWDGSGYPQGLVGEAIPLSGRIVALADVFDALTTRRRYKAEMDPHEALNLIRQSSGQLFDPALVEVFSEKFEDILKARENYLKDRRDLLDNS